MLKKIMLAAGLMLASQMASAVPVKWTLTGVNFSDESTATGSFVYDADLNAYSDWDITTQTAALSGYNYTTDNSYLGTVSGGGLANADASGVLFFSSVGRYINLNFLSDMTNAGGTIGIDKSPYAGGFQTSSWECNNCSTARWVIGGSITGTAVPEPATIALLGLGLVGLGLSRRRR